MVEARIQGRRQRLAARDECSPTAASVSVVLFVARIALDDLLDDLLDVADLDKHVLRLQVGVDDAALPVEVVEAEQHLLCDLLHQGHADATVVPPLDEPQQVLAQHLKHHAHVCAVRASVLKRIKEADDVLAAGVIGLRLDNLVQEFDFVNGRLGVMGGGPHDLEGNVLAIVVVARQPDGGEVAPAQLADDGVSSIFELLPDGDGMVAAFAVVLGILLVGGVIGGVFGSGRGCRGLVRGKLGDPRIRRAQVSNRPRGSVGTAEQRVYSRSKKAQAAGGCRSRATLCDQLGRASTSAVHTVDRRKPQNRPKPHVSALRVGVPGDAAIIRENLSTQQR